VVLLGFSLCLGSCVIIPYQPEAETRQTPAEVPNPELVRLSVGPRELLKEVGKDLHKADARIEVVDGQSFLDAAAPAGELTLASLLDPATAPRIEALAVDYLVLVGKPETRELSSRGGMFPFLGFWGLQQVKSTTTCRAVLVDLRQLRLLEETTSTATGTDSMAGWFYGLFIVSDTGGGAQEGLVHDVVGVIAAAQPAGPVRVVLAAAEVVRTDEEVGAEMAAAKRTALRTRQIPPGSVEALPAFSEPAPLAGGAGLIYLYRPENIYGSALPLAMRVRSPAGELAEYEVTRLWSGGYFPFHLPAGTVEVWVATEPDEVVALDVAPGEIYYLRATFRAWSLKQMPSRLEVVESREGRREVRRCRQLPSTAEHIAQTREAAELGYTQQQLELADLYATGVTYGPNEGLPSDDAEAYKWYSIVIGTDGTRPEWQTQAVQRRQIVAARMSPENIVAGARRSVEWLDAAGAVHR
jgi:hypothetical protein